MTFRKHLLSWILICLDVISKKISDHRACRFGLLHKLENLVAEFEKAETGIFLICYIGISFKYEVILENLHELAFRWIIIVLNCG